MDMNHITFHEQNLDKNKVQALLRKHNSSDDDFRKFIAFVEDGIAKWINQENPSNYYAICDEEHDMYVFYKYHHKLVDKIFETTHYSQEIRAEYDLDDASFHCLYVKIA
jgi:hypothetical protein